MLVLSAGCELAVHVVEAGCWCRCWCCELAVHVVETGCLSWLCTWWRQVADAGAGPVLVLVPVPGAGCAQVAVAGVPGAGAGALSWLCAWWKQRAAACRCRVLVRVVALVLETRCRLVETAGAGAGAVSWQCAWRRLGAGAGCWHCAWSDSERYSNPPLAGVKGDRAPLLTM